MSTLSVVLAAFFCSQILRDQSGKGVDALVLVIPNDAPRASLPVLEGSS